MRQILKKFSPIYYSDKVLVGITILISLIAFVFYYYHGNQNLSYYDAIARLNTARKMIDSITPGIGQLGGIWLPFPQILMVPFIWNNFLWHSGLAGYLISGTAFVIAALFLVKAFFIITHKRSVSLLLWFLFVSNKNILLLQTMAMSEMFFICFSVLTCYFLIKWIKEHKLIDFLLIGFCLMVLTLTRYEGYFIFFGVFAAVFIECIRTYTFKKREKIEGLLLLFLTVSGFGIILWCIYSALFYKDPLFWLHSYSPPPQTSILKPNAIVENIYAIQDPTLLQSLQIYSSASMWTNGIITVFLGLCGVIVSLINPKRIFLSLLTVSVILFLFLIYGYFKGFIPLIEFPPVYLIGNKVRDWSIFADNNVRYGIVLLPSFLFFTAFMAAKNRFFYTVAAGLIFVQSYFSFTNPTLVQYQFGNSWRFPHLVYVPWFKEHYSGGLVLVAASRHEDFMFETGLPYKNFIYEGTRKYWYNSLAKPSRFANWVIFDTGLPDDDVTNGLSSPAVADLKKHFSLVYRYKGLHIYEKKT